MARCPFAIWKPLPENRTQAAIVPTQLIFHSTWGGRSNPYNFFATGTGNESHFWVDNNGVLYQFVDTEVRADAQWSANARAISVETADLGDPHSQGWTPAQLDTLVRLAAWANDVHRIPLRTCPAADAPGVGWHAMWHDWNKNDHDCPGPARVAQIPTIITRAQEDDMPLTDADAVKVARAVHAQGIYRLHDPDGTPYTFGDAAAAVRNVPAVLAVLSAKLDELAAKVDALTPKDPA